eukprot:augustus_masked-scaffold_8-processed-gene-10.7-mRNA-1 protein AED:0.38 eAED:0.42 QI:0/-1/0/1/-1/1/1/0/957
MARPPPNYIPGLGRGAMGFTTGADIGPAAGRNMMPLGRTAGGQQEMKGTIFTASVYEKDDFEADEIWDSVDRKMKERHKKKAKVETGNKTISEEFSGLKEQLKTMSAADWDAIPEASTGIKKRKQVDKFTPVPDSVLTAARKNVLAANSVSTHIDSGVMTSLTSVGTGLNNLQNISVSSARKQLLTMNLDKHKVSESSVKENKVNVSGYLTEMATQKISTSAEIGDIKNARALYRSLTKSNPKKPSGWIAAARLEEFAGNLTAAKKKILQGCNNCKFNEDIWAEACRLFKSASGSVSDEAKSVVAQGIKAIPTSVKLWLLAADLEVSVEKQINVLRRGIEYIPDSVKLWERLVEQYDGRDGESREEAIILLNKAVECVPQSVSMWLALAKAEAIDGEFTKSKQVLNAAREEIPSEPKIWIAACQLEEKEFLSSNGGDMNELNTKLEMIMKKCLKSFKKRNVFISRNRWLEAAVEAENQRSYQTARAIIFKTIQIDVEERDIKRTLVEDRNTLEKQGCIVCGRWILEALASKFPNDLKIWIQFEAFMERNEENQSLRSTLPKLNAVQVLYRAVKECTKNEVLYLMLAKKVWKRDGNPNEARNVLESAFETEHKSPRVWFALSKIEIETGKYLNAQDVLARARESVGKFNQMVWLKSAVIERILGNETEAAKLAEAGLEFLESPEQKGEPATTLKLFLFSSQSIKSNPTVEMIQSMKKLIQKGIQYAKTIPKMTTLVQDLVVSLWVQLSRVEELTPGMPLSTCILKARSVLESARLSIPESEKVFVESIKFEIRIAERENLYESAAIKNLFSKAFQVPALKKSGIIWAMRVKVTPRIQQKAISQQALEHCGNDPWVLASVASLFWRFRKVNRSRKYYKKALELNSDLGDIWAAYYAFEAEQKSDLITRKEVLEGILKRIEEAAPTHGEIWPIIKKNPLGVGQTLSEKLEATFKHPDFFL